MQPFMYIPVNASYCIASTLPSTISPISNNPSSTLKRINIHCIHPAVRTSWRDVYHAPQVLKTDVQPTSELYARTMALLQTKAGEERQRADVRLIYDPGKYMCGFIYYEGLVERWHAGEERNVLFYHVRPWINDVTLGEGREVAMALIRAAVGMVEERRMKVGKSRRQGGFGECCVVS